LVTASAQIPNGGFENWVNQGGYLEPVGWLTYNDVQTVGGSTVEQGVPGNPGSFHVVVTTRQATGGGSPIQGWVSAGTSGTNSGFPYTARPAMLTGQWQYGIQPNDTAQILVALNNGGSGTPVALGTLEVTGSLGAWQMFQVPLTYLSTETPDTAYIQIVSSINFGDPIVGSFVKVDDLDFLGTVGVNELPASAALSVLPNPGSNEFTLFLPPGAHRIDVFDATGRCVLVERTNELRPLLDARGLAPGIFLVSVRNERGEQSVVRWVKE